MQIVKGSSESVAAFFYSVHKMCYFKAALRLSSTTCLNV